MSTTLDVILQARARDKGLARFLSKNTKLADQLADSLDKVVKAGGSLGDVAGALPTTGGRRRRGGGAATGSEGSGPVTGDPEASATGRARRRRAGIDGAVAGSGREDRARRRSREQSSEDRVREQARRRGDRRARQQIDRDTEERLGGGGGRKGRGGGRSSAAGKMDFAANASIAANEWRQFGSEVRGGIEEAVGAFSDYEKSVTEVTTLTPNISADEIKQITQDAAREFGGLPTAQVEAFYQIVSAGATDAASATAQLDQANKLAIGGVATAEESVLAISKGVANFKAEGAEAADVADSLFTAVQLGQTSVASMARALPRVAEAASSSGVGLDETNAALAVLSTKLPSAEEAATSLKSAFSNIQKPTKSAREEAKRLGVDFSVAGIKAAGGFDQFLLKLRASEKFDDNTLSKFFESSEARAAIGGLMNDMETYQSVLGAMDKKEGAAGKAYDKMADTTAQKTEKLKAEWELLKITAGEALVPALTEIAKEVAPIIKDVTTWIKENPKLAGGIGKVAIGLAGMSLVLGPVLSLTSLISSTAGLASGALGGLGSAGSSAGGSIGGILSKIGPAGVGMAAAAVGAFALGAAFGTWLDNKFGISDFLSDTAMELSDMGAELDRLNNITPKKIQHAGKTENEVLLAQRGRLLEDVQSKKKLANDAGWWDPAKDTKVGLHQQALSDLRRFDKANAEKLGITKDQSYADSGKLATSMLELARATDAFRESMKTDAATRAAPAPGWTGPSLEAGLS